MKKVGVGVALLITAVLAAYPYSQPADSPGSFEVSTYLSRSHSHNDYAQDRPLFEALERGFASIEVDVFLRDGKLLVAHEADEVSPSVTLRGLYLDPLRSIVRRNGGSVYQGTDHPLQLLIDVKSDADPTYVALRETLRDYEDIFTSWTDEGSRPGPVTAVLSGNRSALPIDTEPIRYLAFDGRVGEDRSRVSVEAMPLVSIDWESLEPQGGSQRLTAARAVVEGLHAEGRKVRFWGTPERARLWTSLLEIGVDYIGTDDPRRLQRHLQD